MANTNCLQGIECPECGGEDEFRIIAQIWVTVRDEGTEDEQGDYEWDKDSACQCTACEHFATVRDFTTREGI